MKIRDSVFIVTGGASGLGEACLRDLVAGGARVALFDLQGDRGAALAEELGGQCRFIATDVIDEASTRSAVTETVDTFGALHGVVNCAGVGAAAKVFSKRGPYPLDDFNRTVQINLIGTFNVLRLAVERMVTNEPNEDGERGVVINTASVAAFDGQIGQAAYSASKAGVVGMTLPIARECADYGIRVVTIAPGLFATPMMAGLPQAVQDSLAQSIPFPKRLGKPEEYAMLTRQIIENPMLNGTVIRLDGSLRMTAR